MAKDWLTSMQNGQAEFALSHFAQAEIEFRRATRAEPRKAEGWINLGAARVALGKRADAIVALERGARLAPQSWNGQFNLACAYSDEGRFSDALRSFQEAARLHPSAHVLNNLGGILRIFSRFEEAEQVFSLALRAEPGHPLVRVNLATLLVLRNRYPEARSALQTVLAGPLPDKARDEARSALARLDERARLEPGMAAAVGTGGLDALHGLLAATPPSELVEDEALLDYFEAVARSLPAVPRMTGLAGAQQQLWPTLEAYSECHLGEDPAHFREVLGAGLPPQATAFFHALSQRGRLRALARDSAVGQELRIRYLHACIFEGQPALVPGHFKLVPNFVVVNPHESRCHPDRVAGTLRRVLSDILPRLEPGAARGMFLNHVVLKLHCFGDGNGRVGRVLLNAELEAAGDHPFIIPARHRPAWLQALRDAHGSKDLGPALGVLAELQTYSAEFVAAL